MKHFLDQFLGKFGFNFGTRSAQAGSKMGPIGPAIASKIPKNFVYENLENIYCVRLLESKAAQDNFRKPKMAT